VDIGVVQPAASPGSAVAGDAGGYANAAAQDAFCANTYCWISTIYDQSPKHNNLVQAPRGGFSAPAMGGFNNLHYNWGCCFDYGNAETDSRDDDNGTMETTYFGDSTGWYHGNAPGPWVMTDQENNLVGCVNPDGSKLCVNLPNITW